ncbi:hypothetical protein JW962_00350, partial [Candidatus Dojkabacteria bacterium]|nr:hypothetical protein [Candidatus Dojkabacteria bacterium]
MYSGDKYILEHLLPKASKGASVTLQGINGVGKNSVLKRVINSSYYKGTKNWVWIDVDELLETGVIDLSFCEKNKNETFVVVVNYLDSLLSTTPEKAHRAQQRLLDLNQLNCNIAFVLISSSEVFAESLLLKPQFKLLYCANIVFMPIPDFDDSVQLMKLFFTEHNTKVFSDSVKLITRFTLGDPVIIKRVFHQILADRQLEEKLTSCKKVDLAYELIGSDYLDQRYQYIVNDLSGNSIMYLLGASKEPTDYLVRSGLINSEGNVFSELFEHYLQKNRKNLLTKAKVDKFQDINLNEVLTGQEFLIFKQLEKAKGKLVDKENIAQTAWGPSWTDSYSEY